MLCFAFASDSLFELSLVACSAFRDWTGRSLVFPARLVAQVDHRVPLRVLLVFLFACVWCSSNGKYLTTCGGQCLLEADWLSGLVIGGSLLYLYIYPLGLLCHPLLRCSVPWSWQCLVSGVPFVVFVGMRARQLSGFS